MGRLIDADFILNKMRTTDAQPITYSEHYAWDFATALLNNAPTVESIPKDKYENRLKADLVAMLTEIQLEIEENSYSENAYGDEYGINKVISTDDIYQIIQQKIDKCKAESEEYVNFADDLIPIMNEAESEDKE